MKSNPALPGGSLTSKPTWSNTFGCSATSVFLARTRAETDPRRRILVIGPTRSFRVVMTNLGTGNGSIEHSYERAIHAPAAHKS